MRVALIDYESGNLHSAEKALALTGRDLGATVAVTADPEAVRRADRIVLPGDGAFPACRAALDAVPGMVEAMRDAVLDRGVPFLGICVGMQLLATTGHEYEETPGLGWIGGHIRRIEPADPRLKVPQMGWNDLEVLHPHPLLEGVATGDHAYFVHSYQFHPDDPAHLLARVDFGGPVTAVVGRDNIAGCQFHPEKSQAAGLRILGNFLRWAP
ncbi:imidazole glycerol phosphate synthase subunit HisH [Paracoccus sp. S-4012]|uniref:imidazole glycerol phosphate synthase subunit HisH n=1 Tax=Paracoccus sp. S-4012 TaxID=2665648 RepID=UPI0012B13309|nr:imidazole glycerol phosphate synthase subunit HisH [Paracoccus sp. S-4012]MRX49104.1 imidazole glycerol phosphate synthase subunit HisH [Paracoccus sp. S-4012]